MDFTPSGRPKLGYSYPSDQRRAGPAPLASFEDLPSDEQISPEGDIGDDNTLQDLSPDSEEFDHILSFDSRDVLTQPSPHKVTIPHRQEQTNGHYNSYHANDNQPISTTINGISVIQSTLPNTSNYGLLSPPSSSGQQLSGCWSSSTPTTVTYSQVCVDEEPASGEVTPTGYSSPMVPGTSGTYDGSSARPSGGSNLMVPSGDESGGEKSPSPDSRRKGSWTDIFFLGRSRSRSKSPIGSECSQKSPNCDQPDTITTPTATNTPTTTGNSSGKNKKGFFSFLKVGRKNSTSTVGTNNGSTPQAQQQSSSHQPSLSLNSSTVAMLSQENDTISSASKKSSTNNENNNNSSSINATLSSSTKIKCDSTISSTSRPNVDGIVDNFVAVGKLHEELTIPQDLNEPCESQQDIINIIEREIEQRMSDLNENLQIDLPLDLQFDEIRSKLSSTIPDNQTASNEKTIDSSYETEISVEPVINTNTANQLPKPNLIRKLRTRSETIDDECQSLPRSFKTKEIESTTNRGTETTVVATIEHNSSEKGYSSGSDLEESSTTLNAEVCSKKAIYLKRQSSETSENDFEAATLLNHDSIDYDDYDGPTELIITPDTEEKLSQENFSRASARRRHDINTIPVDRPRSTTPINIAPLEAFLSTPSPDPNVEKIRLSLPGDTFISANYANNCSRVKSPRKSNPAIWLEFCEKGLHSPKNYHRRRRSTFDNSSRDSIVSTNNNIPGIGVGVESLGINFAHSTADAFTPVNETSSQAVSPLTPITPLDFEDQWTPFGDNFNPYAFIKENLESTVERYKWSMECDKCDCLIGKLGSFNSNDPSGCNTPAEDQITPLSPPELAELNSGDEQPLVSPIACSCDCHLNMSILPSNNQANKGQKHQHPQQDGVFSISSDISSASSRLIQASSASSSKSSLVGDVEDKALS